MDEGYLLNLDKEARELLSLVREIKIDLMLEKNCQEKIDKALLLSQQIFADLYHLREEE
ncbi:hypothetical protein [Sulfolobus spindle-shaped virus]|nr:hypothetical protein [Sulfolobus spindle-shaped virus]QGA87266.1 hypothetical protein [Sulfolobus spindle-shaped virus]QGA87292.1 hypothetical protein [Sulfolobus spindle-shaped virus]